MEEEYKLIFSNQNVDTVKSKYEDLKENNWGQAFTSQGGIEYFIGERISWGN